MEQKFAAAAHYQSAAGIKKTKWILNEYLLAPTFITFFSYAYNTTVFLTK